MLWMHTFSPSRMWIGGLSRLSKHFCHLHTQFNRDLPWDDIDMDFMNLNQAAHGDREAGFLHTPHGTKAQGVVGAPAGRGGAGPPRRLGAGGARLARPTGGQDSALGDNMREVAVTEGDKVAAELRFGFSVNG